MDQAPEQKPRIEGVKYRKVRLYRSVTTTIDGVPSTRREPYDGWEPVPPRDWDEAILRGAAGVAIAVTIAAVAGGTASIGGLLDELVPAPFAYAMGSCFAGAWLFCTALEWRNRTAPDRARPARAAGWFFLLLSMGAVLAYGHTKNALWAGAFGACLDVISKGSWLLLLREYAVPLDADVAHWVRDQEQKIAGRALLAGRVRRLHRRAAYQRAVGGPEFQAADKMLTYVEARHTLPEAAAEPAPEPAPAPAPVVAAPPAAPAAPAATTPADQPASSVPSADEQNDQRDGEQPAPVPPVSDITRPSMAAICRKEIAANATITDAELVAAVLAAGHPKKDNLADTVRRTARRVDPKRKAS